MKSLADCSFIHKSELTHFNKIGLYNIDQLVNYIPSNYTNLEISDPNLVIVNTTCTIKATIISKLNVNKNNKFVFTFEALSNGVILNVTLFRTTIDFLNYYHEGQTVLLVGKLEEGRKRVNFKCSRIITNKVYLNDDGGIFLNYNIDKILNSRVYTIIKTIFDNNLIQIKENLPQNIILNRDLLSKQESIRAIHLSRNSNNHEKALYRLKYEEAFFFAQRELFLKNKHRRNPLQWDNKKVAEFIISLPYTLTDEQKAVLKHIFQDFRGVFPMFRLLQGDTGTGKTIVSLIASIAILSTGKKVALMCPTEILAKQHYSTFLNFCKDNYNILLLVGSLKNKDQIKQDLANGNYDIVVGTHSLIQDDVILKDLGFIIVDEQQKFGEKHRAILINKGSECDTLFMSATPIPRTLGIAYFGNLSNSYIKKRPNEESKLTSKYLTFDSISIVIDDIKHNIESNKQTLVVVPTIKSEKNDFSMEKIKEFLEVQLEKSVYCINGKITHKKQDETLLQFTNDLSGVLLGTSILEVGVDFPNATIMAVIGSEYFGLSSLHQLRGRVGRYIYNSTCYFITKEFESRIEQLEKITDGITLAEKDFQGRGPGDYFGTKQSGKLDGKYLDYTNDLDILTLAFKDTNL